VVTKPHKSAERKLAAHPTGRVLSEAELLDRLRAVGALSAGGLDPAKAFEQPGLVLSLGVTLAERLAGVAVDAVLPAAPQSIVLGFAAAFGIGARLLTEVGEAQRVLVVTAVVDGAPSLMEVLGLVPPDALAGVACLFEGSGASHAAERLGVPFVSLARAG